VPLPSYVLTSVQGLAPNQQIVTVDPTLQANCLPPYPPLPVSAAMNPLAGGVDMQKVEEIRRTIMVTGLGEGAAPDKVRDVDAFNGRSDVFPVKPYRATLS
jgi:hypothetical protein